MSTREYIKITPEDVQKVQDLIEQCLWEYMNKKQVMDTLNHQQNIQPTFTKLVWERLEEQNQEFFKNYYIRLALKDQMTRYNKLLHQQYEALKQFNPHGFVVNQSHIPASKFVYHGGNPAVNYNASCYVPENIAMKAEDMQQHIPVVVEGGFSDCGQFVQSEMQHGPVNMVVDQNFNRLEMTGPGYFGNSRFLYQPGHGSGMESHRDVSRFGIMNSVPVQYHHVNGTVMFSQPESTADFGYSTVADTHRFSRSTLEPWFSGEKKRFGDISRNFDFQNFGRDSLNKHQGFD